MPAETERRSAARAPRAEDGARLLCVGDVHLGRRPGGLPPGVDSAPHGPAAALERAVQRALDERVDAVLFAGDVVDAERDFFEAYRPLATAARCLLAAGIEVVCVAGNHDVHVLPRLAREVEGVRLLGERGTWELHVVRRAGRPVCRVLGWSFPEPRVTRSPLGALDAALLAPASDPAGRRLPTLGLLHADLDAAGSVYAPVGTAELAAVHALDGWLLGHVHAPSALDTSARPLGYLGSLSALDPGATGARGPWLADWDGGAWRLRHLASSSLRFERIEVDLTEADDAAAMEERLLAALRAVAERIPEADGAHRLVGVRARLVGRTRLARASRDEVAERARDGLRPGAEGVQPYLESVEDCALPALALEPLAEGTDPPGLLAQRILALQAGGAEARRLVARALPALRERVAHATFSAQLGADEQWDEERVRGLLLDAARRALEELLAQRAQAAEAWPAAAPHVATQERLVPRPEELGLEAPR